MKSWPEPQPGRWCTVEPDRHYTCCSWPSVPPPVRDAALEALRTTEPSSAAALDAALEPSIARGWRVLTVTAPAGSDGVGILGAVCLPLASLPLLNVSTLDNTFVMLPEAHVDEALERLKPHFDVARQL